MEAIFINTERAKRINHINGFLVVTKIRFKKFEKVYCSLKIYLFITLGEI